MLKRILALVAKEFLVLFKDPKSRFIIIGPPVIQLLIFGYAATFDLSNVPFAVYNQSPGADARDLVARFEGSPNFKHVASIIHDGQIAPLIDRKQVLMVIRIGPRFGRDLQLGQRAPVQIIVDGRNSNTAMLAAGYARRIVDDFNAQRIARSPAPTRPARLVVRAWYNPNLLSRWFIVPGIVCLLTLVVTMLVTALSVAREREQGTFDQLLVTPLHPWEILLGKALPGFVIGTVEATVIMLVAVFWFKVPFIGHLATFYTGLVLFLLSAIGVGLMISSLSVTQQQGLLGAFLFLVPSIILSGFATPILNMPPLVQKLTLLNPMRYFMIIVRGVFLEGTPFVLLIDQFWPLAVIGVVNLCLAAWLFRSRIH